MKDINIQNKNKLIGAVISSLGFSLFCIIMELIIIYFQFSEEDKIPWIMFIFITICLLAPVMGIVYNLIERVKEILGGEEDEASKY